MGLDVYLYDGEIQIQLPSTKHPDHLFKIGYFRSSYNGGGFDSVMRRSGLSDLRAMFAVGDAYEFAPDWATSLARAEQALVSLDAYTATPTAAYEVMAVGDNMFSGPNQAVTDERAALDIFARELERDTQRNKEHDSFMGRAYSNRDGEFHFGNGLKVHGFVRGIQFKIPCTYVVFHAPDRWTFYREALEVVIETCQYVLANPNPDGHLLHWLG